MVNRLPSKTGRHHLHYRYVFFQWAPTAGLIIMTIYFGLGPPLPSPRAYGTSILTACSLLIRHARAINHFVLR